MCELALAEKIAVLETEDYLNNRSKRGNRSKYLEILNKAPNVKPASKDKL